MTKQATEKQIAYINGLIGGLQPENVPYLAKGEGEGQRRWMSAALGENWFALAATARQYAAIRGRYEARIAEIEQINFTELERREASAWIAGLQKVRLEPQTTRRRSRR